MMASFLLLVFLLPSNFAGYYDYNLGQYVEGPPHAAPSRATGQYSNMFTSVELGSGSNFGSSMRIHSHFSSSSSGSAPQVNNHFMAPFPPPFPHPPPFGTQMGLSSSFGFPHPPAVLNQLDEEDDEGEQPKAVVRPVPKNAAAAKAKEPEAPAPNVVNKSKTPFKGINNTSAAVPRPRPSGVTGQSNNVRTSIRTQLGSGNTLIHVNNSHENSSHIRIQTQTGGAGSGPKIQIQTSGSGTGPGIHFQTETGGSGSSIYLPPQPYNPQILSTINIHGSIGGHHNAPNTNTQLRPPFGTWSSNFLKPEDVADYGYEDGNVRGRLVSVNHPNVQILHHSWTSEDHQQNPRNP